MNEQLKLAQRLDGVRRDLDEVAERLARVLADGRSDDGGDHELVGQTEIAAMLGVPANTVGVWIGRGKLPPPVATLACGRIWRRSEIVAWQKRREKS